MLRARSPAPEVSLRPTGNDRSADPAAARWAATAVDPQGCTVGLVAPGYRRLVPSLVLVCILTTGGCGAGTPPPAPPEAGYGGATTAAPPPGEDALPAPARGDTRLWIGPELAECVGVGPQKCMLVREGPEADWEYFYGGIDGFTYAEGTSYVIDVIITEVEDPPADGSSLHYRLTRLLESRPVDPSSWRRDEADRLPAPLPAPEPVEG